MITILLKKEKQSSIISDPKEENNWLKFQLDNMSKSICMLNNNFTMLDEILEVGKISINMKGIGFEPRSMNKKDKTLPKKFVPPKNKIEF